VIALTLAACGSSSPSNPKSKPSSCPASGCARHRANRPPQRSTPSIGSSRAQVPVHTETWAYDDCGNGGVGAPSALVRYWASYVEANCGINDARKALADCHSSSTFHCQVMQYLDTNIIYYAACCFSPQWPSWSAVAQESWYLHQPSSSTRVSTPAFGGGYYDNQASAAVQSFYESYVRAHYARVDGLFMDDQAPSLELKFVGANASSSGEVSSDARVRSGHAAMSAALARSGRSGSSQYENTVPQCGEPDLPQGLGPSGNMVRAPVAGLVAEGCPTHAGRLSPFTAGLLDDIAWVQNNTPGSIVVLSDGARGASYQTQSRMTQEAFELLGYKPGKMVSWPVLEQGSTSLSIWPEAGIYPTDPLQTMASPSGTGCLAATGAYCPTHGHNDLQVSSGVYVREFARCYDQGRLFGPCAAVMNTTGSRSTVSSGWLNQPYHHHLTVSGGDVQSGGTIDLTGAPFTAGTSTVDASSALILTP
jgi:hypothetical protein